jgi:ABC-type polysaccharide/polyol phosphate transport system ATPase subunit
MLLSGFKKQEKDLLMSSDNIVIRINDISKSYQIYDKPRDRLKQFIIPRLRRFTGQQPKQYFREFWSLKNISFEVKKGETIGIIGKNGAGKSTLLQILCGTITPSNGTIETKGRIAALLELGAGFNPEFTGRENVFLNASLLGLTKEETVARFSDIVSFADIDDFLEQPVKTYSSGMFVRLAFAIAVHIEPDILIIDEALSVGDIAFRNKCIAKIKELRESGTTLLFVSHDLSTLQMICDQVVWLEAGKVREIGNPLHVCQEYYVSMIEVAKKNDYLQDNDVIFIDPSAEQSDQREQTDQVEKHDCPLDIVLQVNTGMAKYTSFKLIPVSGDQCSIYKSGGEIHFGFSLQAIEELEEIVFTISIYRDDGDWVIGQTSREENVFWPAMMPGDTCCGNLILKPLCLAPGNYHAASAAYSPNFSMCYAMTDIVCNFSVRSDFPTWGKLINPCEWKCIRQSSSGK